MGKIVIEKGAPDMIDAVAPEQISILVKKGEKDGIRGELELNDKISAPITMGDEIGELVIYKQDKEIARHPLVASENVGKAGLMQIYFRMLKTLI